MHSARVRMGIGTFVAAVGAAFLAVASPFSACTARADVVTTTSEVTSAVNVREQPSLGAPVIARLAAGERLRWAAETDYWFEVVLSDGRHGFVNRRYTERIVVPPAFTVAVADVGTGLGVFVRGPDFSMVYDAGSHDDTALGANNRFVAFLEAIAPDMDTIDYVVLSHPHEGHVSLLADVLGRYRVRHVLDPGAVNPVCGYQTFIEAVSREPNVDYRTAARGPGSHVINFGAPATCNGEEIPSEITIVHGEQLESGRTITLGENASMRILHADGGRRQSFNANSLVIRLDLGSIGVLLTGDAEAGARENPDVPPSPISLEGKLLAWHPEDLRSDVLLVAAHGSKSSSRKAFLDAVQARIFLVSSGPTPYDGVVLPDPEVITELNGRGMVFRTDFNDASCGDDPSKIGPDADGKPGGCDNIVVTIDDHGQVEAAYWRHAD